MARRLPPGCDLTAAIPRGSRVLIGHACGEPQTLTEALVAQRAALGPLPAYMTVAFSDTFAAEHADHLAFTSIGAMGTLARLARAGVLDILPCHAGRISAMIRAGTIGCEVVLIQLSPAGPDGLHSYGLINDHMRAAIERAAIVIAEINDQVPYTLCDRMVHPSGIDWYVETSRPPVALATGEPSAVERSIAVHVARYIGDGATLQIGIGGVPDAVTRLLADRRDLGVHSGMIGDSIVDLIEAGIVTNARKPIDRGVTVASVLVGSERLYRFAHRNPAILLRDSLEADIATALNRLPGLVSINSAIEVDITGQVNAEQAGDLYLGATGGQPDFVRASARSPGGRAIIALPSTAARGTASRIVPALSGPVTTPRADVDVIVTEYGAAELKGRSLRERAKAMTAIAHPDFREALERSCHGILARGF